MSKLEQFNYFTGHKYSGQNTADLASRGHKSNQWATYKQWFEHDKQVQKGEKSVTIMAIITDDTGKKAPLWYRVFNLEQVAPITAEQE